MSTIADRYEVFTAPKKTGNKQGSSKSFYKYAKSHITGSKNKDGNKNLSQTIDKVVYGVER